MNLESYRTSLEESKATSKSNGSKGFHYLLNVKVIGSSLSLLVLAGCAQNDRFKPFEKEFNDPMPTKYETPFNQTREPFRNEPSATVGVPREAKINPEVIEPDPYLPGTSTVMYGIPIKGKPGFVLSPYAPDKGFVDVRGFPPDSDVRDPYTGRIMKVPLPAESEEASKPNTPMDIDTLSAPVQQTPDLTDDVPPSPPVLEP
jgi:hypothetical protein